MSDAIARSEVIVRAIKAFGEIGVSACEFAIFLGCLETGVIKIELLLLSKWPGGAPCLPIVIPRRSRFM